MLAALTLLLGILASTVCDLVAGLSRCAASWSVVLYFAKLRYLPVVRFCVASRLAAGVTIVFILMYTSFRHEGEATSERDFGSLTDRYEPYSFCECGVSIDVL